MIRHLLQLLTVSDSCFIIYSLTTHSFIHSPIHSLTHVLTHLLVYLLTYLLVHSLTHSLTYLFSHSFVHLLTHSFIHSFIHSLIHSFIHSLALYPVSGWRKKEVRRRKVKERNSSSCFFNCSCVCFCNNQT